MDTLMNQNETNRVKKEKFEYRVVSRLKAFSGNSGPSRFHRRVKKQRFLNQVSKLKRQALG